MIESIQEPVVEAVAEPIEQIPDGAVVEGIVEQGAPAVDEPLFAQELQPLPTTFGIQMPMLGGGRIYFSQFRVLFFSMFNML